MADYGIKITKATKGITSSTLADYHFWSKYRAKSVKYQGTLAVTTNSGTDPAAATNSYTHSFGYIPQFMIFATSNMTGQYMTVGWSLTENYGKSGDLQTETLSAYVTSSTVNVSALWDYYTPMSGTSDGIVDTYTFDILLFMEEVETS